MASTIASPVPQSPAAIRPTKKDLESAQHHDGGRATPLPQYEKTQQTVPFTLTLQEEENNPGQFQLVVNIDQKYQKQKTGSAPQPAVSKKLIANLKELPSLGYDVSPLYHTLKSSPPASPQDEKQGWSDLDAIPPEFLNKVVPDWKVTFSRSDSTASSQSRKLADIKARIKKSGKGFVVRLLKGSASDPDTNDIAEVHLGSKTTTEQVPGALSPAQELSADTPPVELDTSTPLKTPRDVPPGIFEIGSSNEPGIGRGVPDTAAARSPAVNQWLQQVSGPSRGTSILEEGLSDAETLLPDVRSIADRLDDTDMEPFSSHSSVVLGRSGSTFSIVKTPTRGLSVVGPVKRVQKAHRAKAKGKAVRSNLNRSGAHKSFKRSLQRNMVLCSDEEMNGQQSAPNSYIGRGVSTLRNRVTNPSHEDDVSQQGISHAHPVQPILGPTSCHHSPAEESHHESLLVSRSHPLVRTDVPRASSTGTSPVAKRKRRPRTNKTTSTSSSVEILRSSQQSQGASSGRSNADMTEELRDALNKVFAGAEEDVSADLTDDVSVSKAEESLQSEVGGILPPNIETRMPPARKRNPAAIFLNLAFTALLDSAFEGLTSLRKEYGSEPPVPPKHVRVRWTCSCGEELYDDFIENKPGAARDLEWFLNRPRSHSPSEPPSKSSTFTSIGSIFDANSRASTLTTPASTYAGNTWGKESGAYQFSPTRLGSNNPFSVRIGSAPESWLLTCANEGRFTPKIVHVDVNEQRIKDDRALALALRDHYGRINSGWFRWARLRGLSRIEFAQFEVHRNRFADIRAAPSMPPVTSLSSEKAPSQHPYTFKPHDLLPPVGSAYLMHLFKHPEDYEGETLTYERSPKRRERLESGIGWGIHLVEGFQAHKVWTVIMVGFGAGSAVFAVIWTIKRGDVQGAFGVASWIITLAGLGVAGLQAWLD